MENGIGIMRMVSLNHAQYKSAIIVTIITIMIIIMLIYKAHNIVIKILYRSGFPLFSASNIVRH